MTNVDIALLIIRIIIGTFFIKHGYHKFKDPHEMAGWLDKLGYKPGIFWSWVLIITEFFGGVFMLLGIAPRIFALLMSVTMIQGIYHRKYVKRLHFVDGWEINYVTLASLIALILLGGGMYSLGYLFGLNVFLS